MSPELPDVARGLRVSLYELFDEYGMEGVRKTVALMASPHAYRIGPHEQCCDWCSLPPDNRLHFANPVMAAMLPEPEILPGLETIEPSPWVAMPDETTRAYLGNGCTASVVAGEGSWRWLVYRQVLNMKTPVQRGTADSELDAREAAARWFDEFRAKAIREI